PSGRPGVVLEHRPDADATLMNVRIRTDARGFRRPSPDLEALRNGNERVVAAVGDSCTLGWGVSEGATFEEDLERILNASNPPPAKRFVVVNAGVGNSNTAMEYARYLGDVRRLHPVWVIIGFFVNDAELEPTATTSPLLRHSVSLAMLSTRLPGLFSATPSD